ncbi:MAG: NAD(P)H-dependent oxidoreductase [Candidatus Levybacteria bacterium]|nr:NAD(P)H-dependent oxidoreductase [Candidatus Levybacteria bacterium]
MTLKIKVIVGSIREGRFGDKPAKWIVEQAKKVGGLSVELLDLRDYQLPMFAEGTSPAYIEGEYKTPEVNRWAKKIAEADGFIVVAPEYNHGYPSSLKNNIDYLYKEWNNKPVCFVGYGSTGGARVIQQLRQVSTELEMAPIRNSVHIMSPWFLTETDGSLKAGVLDVYVKSAESMLVQLIWWSNALKKAREQ